MRELLEELKYNRKVNLLSGRENRIDINYMIERLEEVNEELLKNIEYFDYHNMNLTNKQYEKIIDIKESLEDKGVFK